MSIELNPITSGYSTGLINENFQKLEQYINDSLLNRANVSTGEPNQMEGPLDMNSNPILNIKLDPDNEGSLLTLSDGDLRYVNTSGDVMRGSLSMGSHPITVRTAVDSTEPIRKETFDQGISSVQSEYQAGDANLQSQLSGATPLEASAFSEVSWHGPVIENSITIPVNKNGWSFGPTMEIAAGQSLTISDGSFWTIANGEATSTSLSYDGGTL